MTQPHEQLPHPPQAELTGFSDVFRRFTTDLSDRLPEESQAEWAALLATLPEHRTDYEQQAVVHAETFVSSQEGNIRSAEPGIILNKLFGEAQAWEEAKKPVNVLLTNKYRADDDAANGTPFPKLRSPMEETSLRNKAAGTTDKYVFDHLNEVAVATSDNIFLAVAPKRSLEDGHLPESTARTIEVMAQHDLERKLEAKLQGVENVLAAPVKRVGRLALRKKIEEGQFTSKADVAAAINEELAKVQAWISELEPDGNLFHQVEQAVRTEGFLPSTASSYRDIERSIIQQAQNQNTPERVMAKFRTDHGLPGDPLPPIAPKAAEETPAAEVAPEPTPEPEPVVDPLVELEQRIAAARAEGLDDEAIYKREVRTLPKDPEQFNLLLRELNSRFRERTIADHDESFAGRYKI